MNNKTPLYLLLSPKEAQAYRILLDAGYGFPANTKIGVFRRMLINAWQERFGDKPFPHDRGESENENE